MSRSVIGRRSAPNAGAAFAQTNLPFPSSTVDESRANDSSPSVRRFVSPAYKRYQEKQKVLSESTRGIKPSIGALQDGIQVPTKSVAKDMGMSFSEMENEPLQIIAEMGNHSARYEVLQRHIMAVDDVEYEQAGKRMQEIEAKCKEGLFLYALPYRVGIFVSVVGGLGAIPMVFDINTAHSFNEAFVTMEVPPADEIDTILETGAWTWNWMEPLTGTLSFTLLTLQFARQQLLNLGAKPFTGWVLHRRSSILQNHFPDYDDRLLSNFVKSFPMNGRE